MLSKEENELITRGAAGTPMGELMRRYWAPALISEEIPAPDCPPVQVRLLGEELVAFRDSNGRIGLLEEHCLHRGTSLFYGRSEDCGLRCIYHGWKYDVEGNVLDTPAEPADSRFKEKLHHRSYPTKEVNGIIWAYLGPPEKMPLFPNYEWASVPLDHSYVTKCLQDCNYLQGLEGECDSSHLNFLHRTLRVGGFSQDAIPEYQTEDTDFGVRLIALRERGEGKTYVRVSSFLMPFGCAVPVGPTREDGTIDGFEIHFYVPAGDDQHSWRLDFGFRRSSAVPPNQVHRRQVIGPGFHRIPNAENHYLQDREKQRSVNFTGMDDFLTHDSCATESMGTLYDRSREHLGVSDKGVIAVRRFMLEAVKQLQQGQEPPCLVTDPELNDLYYTESTGRVIEGRDWRGAMPYLARSAQEYAAVREASRRS